MLQTYAYSFDRDSFRGAFTSREQAVEFALEVARAHPSPVDAVYVGKPRVPADPHADHHAEHVLATMRERMRAKTGDSAYLTSIDEQVVAELDTMLTSAIAGWLRRHGLEPATRVSAISEHPMPAVHEHAPVTGGEIGSMGMEE